MCYFEHNYVTFMFLAVRDAPNKKLPGAPPASPMGKGRVNLVRVSDEILDVGDWDIASYDKTDERAMG